jgi:hypothetical protein
MKDYDKLVQKTLQEMSSQAAAQATGIAAQVMIQRASANLQKEIE